MPFAAPPVGDLRWKAPPPAAPWTGVRKADTWGTRCMQGDMWGGPIHSRETTMGEDCLYLNVWTPAVDARRAKDLPPGAIESKLQDGNRASGAVTCAPA